MLNSLSLEIKSVNSISLQPGSAGNVFAVTGLDENLRIYDIRCKSSFRKLNPHFKFLVVFCVLYKFLNILSGANKLDSMDMLLSVMFSPVHSSVIAVAGLGGTQLLDIRHSARYNLNTFVL